MKNSVFEILFNNKTGLVQSIVNISDADKMNWCLESGSWGYVHDCWRHYSGYGDELRLVDFCKSEARAKAVFENRTVRVLCENFFDDDGNFVQKFTLKNISDTVLFLNENSYCVEVPFNDVYTNALDCIAHRCNTHIWSSVFCIIF